MFRDIAKAWAKKFGKGNDEKAFIEGVKAALAYAMRLCITGEPPSMIRGRLGNLLDKLK